MYKRYFIVAALMSAAATTSVADQIDGEELVDPTRPLFAAMPTSEGGDAGVLSMIRNIIPSNYDVTFIRASSVNPVAIVNSVRVTIGDEVGGASVVAIDRNSVTLSVDGEDRRISLYDDIIKRPVAQ